MPQQQDSSSLSKAKRFAAIAFDPEVLKVAVPAYCLPLADLGLSALGLDVLRGVWFWLFAPAVGLLLTGRGGRSYPSVRAKFRASGTLRIALSWVNEMC